MPDETHPIFSLLKSDPRYKLEAYQFVRDGLAYAQEVMNLGKDSSTESADDLRAERHLTGQQLCEAIRKYALEQYGFMAQTVLGNWGITSTSDFGELVYNLIEIGMMKKSKSDRRADFDNVYDFDVVFRQDYKITVDEEEGETEPPSGKGKK